MSILPVISMAAYSSVANSNFMLQQQQLLVHQCEKERKEREEKLKEEK